MPVTLMGRRVKIWAQPALVDKSHLAGLLSAFECMHT